MYGPWTIKATLYTGTEAKIALTTDGWILKIGDFIDSETEILSQIKNAGVRRSVEIPDDYKGADWYAMRRYDDYLACNVYCRSHWRTFAVNILEFLEDLHHSVGLVHMDIKKANILIDKRTNTCVVADYEHAVRPNHKWTGDYDADTSWYYVALGAEFDKPLFSWRMDLVAVAYVLSDLSAPKCRPLISYRQFEHECYMRRVSKPAMTLEEILVLRGADIAAAHPDLQEYWRRVGQLSWYATTPPPHCFYAEMRALLTGFLNSP